MIHLLKSDKYRGQLSKPKRKGSKPIFRGRIEIAGENVLCFIKPIRAIETYDHLPYTFSNNEAVSESLGYLLAKTSGLPVPDKAGLIYLYKDQLPDEIRSIYQDREDGYLCWFSEDAKYPDYLASMRYDENMPPQRKLRVEKRIANQLKDEASIHSVIAFDDWVLNSDRNFGNLLVSHSGPLLIDHGRIFRYPDWTPGTLGTAQPGPQNKILYAIDKHNNAWSQQLPNSNKRMNAFSTVYQSFKTGNVDKARELLSTFFDDPDIDKVVNLLHSLGNDTTYGKNIGLLV